MHSTIRDTDAFRGHRIEKVITPLQHPESQQTANSKVVNLDEKSTLKL